MCMFFLIGNPMFIVHSIEHKYLFNFLTTFINWKKVLRWAPFRIWDKLIAFSALDFKWRCYYIN